MTPIQHELVAKLLRSLPPVSEAVKLVLVEGKSPSEAARIAGISVQSMSNALTRYRGTHGDIMAAYVHGVAMETRRPT